MTPSVRGKVRMASNNNTNRPQPKARRHQHTREERKPLERFPRFFENERVFIPGKNRFGTVLQIQFDPKWGPQLFIAVYPNDDEKWAEDESWFRHEWVEKIHRKRHPGMGRD